MHVIIINKLVFDSYINFWHLFIGNIFVLYFVNIIKFTFFIFQLKEFGVPMTMGAFLLSFKEKKKQPSLNVIDFDLKGLSVDHFNSFSFLSLSLSLSLFSLNNGRLF